ncbi:MAG: GAF domain-containing protein [Bryobacteraceae bacterium]
MSQLSDRLESCKSSPDPWTAALQVIIAATATESGTIHLMGGDGALHIKTSINIPAIVLDKVQIVPVGKGMAGLAAERHQPVTICNIQTDTSGDVRPGARATGMEGAIALPMFAGDRVAGVLGVANRSERTFTDVEQQLLLEAGRQLAGWIA